MTPARYLPQPGKELTIDYGAKSNEELLFLYGVRRACLKAGQVSWGFRIDSAATRVFIDETQHRQMLCWMSLGGAAHNAWLA